MFGRKRVNFSDIPAEEIENILGVILTNRPSIMNYGDISKSNIFAGSVIGKAFNKNQNKLSDEFDFVVMFLGQQLLLEKGIEASTIEVAQKAMLQNLLDPDEKATERYLIIYERRLQDYASATDINNVAARLLQNVAVEPLNDREIESSGRLAEQLSVVKKFIAKAIQGELKAAQAAR